jgi:hypothetical protein
LTSKEGEKRILSTAKEREFRVLVPVVRFLHDRKARVELVEL